MEMEVSGNPRHRRPSFCVIETPGVNKIVKGTLPSDSPKGKRPPKETLWLPKQATTADRDGKHSSSNVIDRKSLYSIKREHIAGRELSFLTAPPSSQHDSSSQNIEHLVEKNYIIDSQLAHATPEKFPRVIMRHFHRVSSTDKDCLYGMPRPPTRAANPMKKLMEDMLREPSIVNIDQYPSLQEPVRCVHTDQFCEILGPSSCQKCIECTNRHIGEELQHMVFPTIDITPDKLIYPKVAQMLLDGHRLQVRKRRLRELGVDMPFELLNFPRQKSHLSSSTCLTCKKPLLNIPPLHISSPTKSAEFKGKRRLRGQSKTARL